MTAEGTGDQGRDELMGPVEVGRRLGVKPQVVVNWIREGRAHPSAVDSVGRNRFTPADVAALRAGLGHRRERPRGTQAPRPEEDPDAS